MKAENLEPTVMCELMDINHLSQIGYFVAINDDECDNYTFASQFQAIMQKVKLLQEQLEERNVKVIPTR